MKTSIDNNEIVLDTTDAKGIGTITRIPFVNLPAHLRDPDIHAAVQQLHDDTQDKTIGDALAAHAAI